MDCVTRACTSKRMSRCGDSGIPRKLSIQYFGRYESSGTTAANLIITGADGGIVLVQEEESLILYVTVVILRRAGSAMYAHGTP